MSNAYREVRADAAKERLAGRELRDLLTKPYQRLSEYLHSCLIAFCGRDLYVLHLPIIMLLELHARNTTRQQCCHDRACHKTCRHCSVFLDVSKGDRETDSSTWCSTKRGRKNRHHFGLFGSQMHDLALEFSRASGDVPLA